jgi:perosamine synthetase
MVRAFEQQFREYLGVRHALAVSNGTAALHLALLAHGIKQGDVVLTTPFTFVSTANSALYVGAKPKFVDIDPETYNIDPNRLQEAIDSKTRALVVVHVFGVPCDMKPILEICDDNHIVLIEDACEALGAEYGGKKVGTFATSCFSFYPNKVVTTAEGGMVCTNDDRVMEMIDSLRNQGRMAGEWLEHAYVGYNYRLSDVHAAIGIPQLRRVDQSNAIRRKKAKQYTAALKKCPQIKTPPDVPGRTWFVYVVELDDRDSIAKRLNDSGIECKPYFPPVHLQTPYRELGFKEGEFPVCESISKRVLALPFFTGISGTQINRVATTLRALVEQSPND